MARSTFFSFHYTRDVWRVNVVRQSLQFFPKGREAGYIDHSLWEEAKLKGTAALESLIDGGLTGSSVTAVLIGAETADRRWVKYEISESIRRGRGLIGIRIHNIANQSGQKDVSGPNPFIQFSTQIAQAKLLGRYSNGIPIYDWVFDSGRDNIGKWVEAAAVDAGYAPIK